MINKLNPFGGGDKKEEAKAAAPAGEDEEEVEEENRDGANVGNMKPGDYLVHCHIQWAK